MTLANVRTIFLILHCRFLLEFGGSNFFVMTERTIFKKSRVIGPWDHKDSVSAKK
jgi:hypothetical protein